MRIIDKNYDYYDYLQYPQDTVVFDRRGSFMLDKDRVRTSALFYKAHFKDLYYGVLLMQCGATFWLLLTTIDKDCNSKFMKLADWKDYDKPNQLLQINYLEFYYLYRYKDVQSIVNATSDLVNYVKRNDYRILSHIGTEVGRDSKVHYPILRASGLTQDIPAEDMFNAIEEYWSIEKTKSETTEPYGITDKIRIENHGFDTKTSFRNVK